MSNEEQRSYVNMSTGTVESLITQLERAVKEAREHGENQYVTDLVRNIEFKVIPTKEERKKVLDSL